MENMIFGIVGSITGVLGLIISIISYNHNKIEAINSYFENSRSIEFINARKLVFNDIPDDYTYDDVDDINIQYGDKIAYIIASYQQMAILVKKRQLPLSFVTDVSVNTPVQIYKKLETFIEYRREEGKYPNPFYATKYQELCDRISKNYKGKLDDVTNAIDVTKLNTTEKSIERIKNNVNTDSDNIIQWCKSIIEKGDIKRKGKNFYVFGDNCTIYINAKTHLIFTAHKGIKQL
jgi:hypothetical protein